VWPADKGFLDCVNRKNKFLFMCYIRLASTPLIADLPAQPADSGNSAVRCARLHVEAEAKGVKLEGGEEILPAI